MTSPSPNPSSQRALLTLQKLYFLLWAAVGLLALLFETDVLPTAFLPADAQTEYVCQLLCVALTLGSVPVALRLLALPKVKMQLEKEPGRAVQWNKLRLVLMIVPILTNLVVYYALASTTGPLFCLLISLAAFVFCYPSAYEPEQKSAA